MKNFDIKLKAYLVGLYWKIKRLIYKETVSIDIAPDYVENPILAWPRNYRCVCGSGIKFKRCCLNQLAKKVTIEDADKLNKRLDRYRA